MVSWRDVQGNKYLTKPCREMLREKGFTLSRNVSIKGNPKSKKDRQAIAEVHYDRDYVVEYVRVKLGGILNAIPGKTLEQIIKEAKNPVSESK